MKKRIKQIALIFVLLLLVFLVFIFTYVPSLSKQAGVVETKLYLGDSLNQPLIVAFGGGGGGNDWSRDYMKGKRDTLIKKGYAVLAIGYFRYEGAPKELDRISLNAISDTIMSIAKSHKIDANKIALIGGSKGGELVLNLASRYIQFKAVIAMSTSHVSFPANTWSTNTSSWMYNGKEVPYVPATLETISPAIKGDLFYAFSTMLQDTEAVKKAEIPVENIKGPILILSGKADAQWPSTSMSNKITERLNTNKFTFYNKHIALNGGHVAPLNHFDLVYDFLETHLPTD